MKEYLHPRDVKIYLPFIIFILIMIANPLLHAQKISYNDSKSKQGFSIIQQRNDGLSINYSIRDFAISTVKINGEPMKQIGLPGHFLPNDKGKPNLPRSSTYIAIPEGANIKLNTKILQTDTIRDIIIAPAFEIPKDTDSTELNYKKDEKVYSRDAFYPEQTVLASSVKQIRGVDVVILGITPFQYNPVSNELIIYRDLQIEILFEGGTDQYGESKYRSRFWDPIIKDNILNSNVLPEMDYQKKPYRNDTAGWEYVIIVPDQEEFKNWADTLRMWRIKEGISSKVVTTSDIGGNTVENIENFINEAYNNWEIPPVAVLLLADFGNSSGTLMSPFYNDEYCISDHIYADVDEDHMADVILARITARNEDDLENMVSKIIQYEKNPPDDPGFYNHPITALGWQTERWFQICSETIGGYFRNIHGKDPVRINAIYSGSPDSVWSSNENTHMVTDYFGPDGLGYIPEYPLELGGWDGGTAEMLNNAINDGAFILQHRDHGDFDRWGEPRYRILDMRDLNNEELTFVFTINCLTGKFNMAGECFTEVFHRHEYGALGLIAATETSFSFVNDTYVWGMYDYLWPDFMPDKESEPLHRGLYPAFANVAGKYFLEASNWPVNPDYKEVTYYLFHHHGGAFSTLYSNVPQALSIEHNDTLTAGFGFVEIKADSGSMIALTVDDKIIGTAEGTGDEMLVPITSQYPPAEVTVTVTKTNHYRYESSILVQPPEGPFVIKNGYTFNDENNNGQIDYTEKATLSIEMKNLGNEIAEDISVEISADDPHISIIDSTAFYGSFQPKETLTVEDGFEIQLAHNIPEGHLIELTVEAGNDSETWTSFITITGHAPVIKISQVVISDSLGNNNGRIDQGETVNLDITLTNTGKSLLDSVTGYLETSDYFIIIHSDEVNYGEIPAESSVTQSYQIKARSFTPVGHEAYFVARYEGAHDYSGVKQVKQTIGQFPVLIIDLDQNKSSGTQIYNAISDMNINAHYTTEFNRDSIPLYNTVFLCLGVYPNNYIINMQQGEALADYLKQGGKLYLESGDTWFYNEETSVHRLFDIVATDDGSGTPELSVIKGIDGTFTNGMSYNYSGDNKWIDHIEAGTTSFEIFRNQDPEFGCAVANDPGKYKTIGSSFELGGLDDGTNTKSELVEKYLQFFGFKPVPFQPEFPQGPSEVCNNDLNDTYFTHPINNADYYIWSIEPSTAGTIIGMDTMISVDWSNDFSGEAYLTVRGANISGKSPLSEAHFLTVHEKPSAMLSDTVSLCKGDSLMMIVNLKGTPPWQIVFNGNSDTLLAGETPWYPYVKPDTTTLYTITGVTDANGCSNTGSGNYLVEVKDSPVFDLGPDTSICCNYLLELSVPEGYAEYKWFDGSTGTSTVVDSSGVGIGTKEVWVRVKHENGCTVVDYLNINFTECAGLDENFHDDFRVYPNPTREFLHIKSKSENINNVNLYILTSIGNIIHSEENIRLDQKKIHQIDVSRFSEGIYFLKITNPERQLLMKIIIQK